MTSTPCSSQACTDVLIDTALSARIEFLESENSRLKKEIDQIKPAHFRISSIQHKDSLVCFYTGFPSYAVFLAFYEFLGPVVDHLNYWGASEGSRVRNRTHKIDPINQLFLTLVKLRLNLKIKDISFRFGVSPSRVSRYLTTWICFLYHHLKELEWMPTVQQVVETLPSAFQESYRNTYAIINGSEIFIETPSDLHMQSSTWSQYKHHNQHHQIFSSLHPQWSDLFCVTTLCWLHN